MIMLVPFCVAVFLLVWAGLHRVELTYDSLRRNLEELNWPMATYAALWALEVRFYI